MDLSIGEEEATTTRLISCSCRTITAAKTAYMAIKIIIASLIIPQGNMLDIKFNKPSGCIEQMPSLRGA